MSVRFKMIGAAVLSGALLMTSAPLCAQAATEVFTATATAKGADGKSASAPLTITIDRKMSESEAEGLVAAFKSGGAAALRAKLVGVPATGTVKIGGGKTVPTRLTIERATTDGRLLTILTDQPLLFLGGSAPDAKPKDGYDFAVLDLTVDARGTGTGMLAPAAKIKLNQDAFVVEDYAAEVVRVTLVKKAK